MWQAQYTEPPGPAAARVGAAGPRLPLVWQAQYTEPPGRAAARVARGFSSQLITAQLLTPHFSHLTYLITTHHSSTSHTIFHTPSLTPSFTHHLSHTQLCHPPFLTHHLSHHLWHTIFHTTLSHTIFHTQLCHTPSFTHSFVTHHVSHTIFHTHYLSHATLSHTMFPPPPPLSFLPSPSPLQHFWLIIGKSWLVGLSGPFINYQ